MDLEKKNNKSPKMSWKNKVFHEMGEYIINVIYLFIFFGVFIWYKRSILAQYGIDYLGYGESLIEALILGKVIMIGKIMNLGGRFEDKPLIFTTLYKSLVFTLFVFLFKLVENAVGGLIHSKGAIGGIMEFITKDQHELLAGIVVIFFAFIPFFAFKELGRVLGEKKIGRLFFRKNKKA